jgi:hypothetical protein
MIWENDDSSVGLKCFAGCTRKEICSGLDITESDLYPQTQSRRSKKRARPPVDLTALSLDKSIDPRLLYTLSITDGYTWHTPKGKQWKNVVRIPYFDLDGSEYSRARIRTALKAKDGSHWEGTGELIPYGLHRLKDASASLIIVEGESDCWTLWQWGIAALGIPGATNAQCLQKEHVACFPSRVYLVREPSANDQPQAGEKFVSSLLSRLQTLGYQGEVYQLDLDATHHLKDPNDLNKLLFQENRPQDFISEWQRVLDAATRLDYATIATIIPRSGESGGKGRRPPDGSEIEPEEGEYIELVEGYFCTQDRNKLWRMKEIEKDGQSYQTFYPLPLQRAGMPRLLEVYNVDGQTDGYLSDETFYQIEWSGRPQQGAYWFTENQLNRGEWLSKFPGIAATSRPKRDFYADIVKSQVDAFTLPIGIARRSTGWHKANGQWEYYFRDGRSTREGPTIPIYGYGFASHSTHQSAWLQHMATLPDSPAPQKVAAFGHWLDAASPEGHMTLLNAFAYRSLITTHVPVETALFTVADDSLSMSDGSSGSGKTTSTDFARGVDGPCPYRAEPDCKFNGSPAGIETRIAPLHDLLTVVSDFHFNGDPTDKQIDDYLDKIDKLVSSVADNAEIKTRANKDMTAKAGTKVGGGLVFDGEKMAPVHLSRLRRMAILQYKRGCIDTGKVHDEWMENQAIHTAMGHAVIEWCHSRLNTDYAAFCTEVRTQETAYAQSLFIRFMTAHMGFDENIARSLSANFARFLTGAWLVEQATGASGLVEKTQEYAYFHLCAHASLIENGGPAQVDREWIIDTTKMLLAHGVAHGLDMDEQPLDPEVHGMLQIHGYKRTLLTDTPWQVSGAYLYNLSDNGEHYWLQSEMWMDILKTQARKEHRQWTLNKQTFPSALVRMGIATPSEDGRSSSRPYIAGKRSRRLHLTNSLWDIDPDPDERAVPPTSSDETSPQASKEQDRSSVGPRAFAENSGPTERSHKGTVQTGSTSQVTENGTAGTAGTAQMDTEYKVHISESDPHAEEMTIPAKWASEADGEQTHPDNLSLKEEESGSTERSCENSGPRERSQNPVISNDSPSHPMESGPTTPNDGTAQRDVEESVPLLESGPDLEQERDVQSVKRFLAKCAKRGVELTLGDDSTIHVESADTALKEATEAFIAKHEVAFILVLTERLHEGKVQINSVEDQWDMTL